MSSSREGGEGRFGGLPRLGGIARGFLGPGRIGKRRAQDLFGRKPRRVRIAPAQPQKQPLGRAQIRPDLAVARRLLRLPRKCRDLARELLQHVVDPGEVLLRAAQLQLGLVPALVKSRDPGRVLEHAAAVSSAWR